MPGKKYRSIKWPRMYEGLKRAGFSKSSAAAISNAAAAAKKAAKRGKGAGRGKGKKGK